MESRSHAARKVTDIEVDVAAYNQRATMFAQSGRYKDAIATFDLAIQLQSDSYTAWYGRGSALAHLKHYSEALASFERAVAIQPNCHAAWTFQAVMLIYLKRYSEALECCDRSITLKPDDAEAWTFRGVTLQRLGKYKQAYASYDVATREQHPSFWQRVMQLFSKLLHLLRTKASNYHRLKRK